MNINFQKKINEFNKLGESFNISPDDLKNKDNETIFDIFKDADGNKNGTIEGDEIEKLQDQLEIGDSEIENLEKLIEEFNKLNSDILALEKKEEDLAPVSNANGTSGPSGGNDYGPQNTNLNGNDQLNQEKTLDNMTLEELETEKNSRQQNVDKAREGINDVFSGDNPAVKAAEQEYESKEQAYDDIMQQAVEQKVITEELNQRREQNIQDIETKQTSIDQLNENINTKDGEIEQKDGEISNTDSTIQALKAALSSYDNAPEDEKGDFAAKKAEISQKLQKAEERKTELEGQKKELEGQKAEFEVNLGEEEAALVELEEQRAAIEQEIMTAVQQAEPQLQMAVQQAMTDFNTAKSNVDTVKNEELTKAKSTLTEAQTSLKEVNEAYEAKSEKTIIGQDGYKSTEMEAIVNYFGEDYLSVLSQEEINKIIKLAKSNKMANIYPGRGSDCLNISYNYEKWALGKYENGLSQFHSENLDTTVQKMAEVLNSGKPVVAKVNTQKGSRHFVLVIGIKQGASAPYKQSDFLCIDSYDGQVDGMGGSGNIKGNYRTLYAQKNQYWLGSHSVRFA